MSLGKRLKAARKRCGKTQADVADHFGVSTQAVSQWEKDKVVPEFAKLCELPRLLEVSADYLLTGDREADELTTLLQNLTGARRRQAIRLLKALIENSSDEAA